jgi:hypothetical protein
MSKTIISLAVAFALSALSAGAFLTHSGRALDPADSPEVRFAEDGAFRDGLYLGKLAAQSQRVQRPAIGRWSGDQDRVSFAAGYRLGYEQTRIHTDTNSAAPESAE